MTDPGGGGDRLPAAVLDVDGTLVDTNYHHAVAWYRASRALDVTLPLYRIHRRPEPDLVKAAVAKAGRPHAVMVGDSTWDCEAARRAGVPSIGVLTGGFAEQELRDAGAVRVFERLDDLRADLASTPLFAV